MPTLYGLLNKDIVLAINHYQWRKYIKKCTTSSNRSIKLSRINYFPEKQDQTTNISPIAFVADCERDSKLRTEPISNKNGPKGASPKGMRKGWNAFGM